MGREKQDTELLSLLEYLQWIATKQDIQLTNSRYFRLKTLSYFKGGVVDSYLEYCVNAERILKKFDENQENREC